MEQYLARQKALELGMDHAQVVREHWELIILGGLCESNKQSKLCDEIGV
jgi:hypothetical protein